MKNLVLKTSIQWFAELNTEFFKNEIRIYIKVFLLFGHKFSLRARVAMRDEIFFILLLRAREKSSRVPPRMTSSLKKKKKEEKSLKKVVGGLFLHNRPAQGRKDL